MSVDKLVENLKNKIKQFDTSVQIHESGRVLSVYDGIANLSGLSHCEASEIISFESGQLGLALNLESDTVGAIILGDYSRVREGEIVTRTKEILSIPVGKEFIGRVVNPLMVPLDGLGDIKPEARQKIERVAPGVIVREPVTTPLHTGIKAIDAMIPIGRGQRELIIGDRQTGKTAIAIDTIVNQKNQDVLCVYVAIGQKQSKVAQIVEKLKEQGALEYTTVVSASSSDTPSLLYLAPYAGVTLAEYFMGMGKDVLIIYDDLSKHAFAYREISLLLRRPPGREAYPGDVFYLHSRLLERACRLNKESGGGSITALPIIETQAGEISDYIPTNVISITDGQIFLESNLFYRGIRPAIDVGISVSRVGSAAQTKAMKKVAGKMKLSMAQYRELESFAQFDSDLDAETKKTLSLGSRLAELLKQNQYETVEISKQVASIFAINEGYLHEVAVQEIRNWEKSFYEYLDVYKKELLQEIERGWSEDIEKKLRETIEEFNRVHPR